ncbi:putative SnoaL-like aldol condensation-catalyzing enzyme [Povalibacter uvarum]|uniref:Putative SnoaL-like aldol condensation-catalyzing enzyme n=1 Tax=Povalibacter uvarum TaxID=732238 RepID=A0A841HXF6_9GAMM|nr:nuclear transport factor 2 family protein [Povalibacter uvarum]MBB6096475.1 putative SnoaL-like aldol condensation-catalyzing enzyme [Povalibacter uvarum]
MKQLTVAACLGLASLSLACGPTAAADLAANKELVRAFFEAVESRDSAKVEKIVREDYIQHVPTIPTGRKAILNYIDMVKAQGKGKMPTIARMIAEGDLVAVHFRRDNPTGPVAAIEIFRIQDGLIAEHWAVTEPFPPASAIRNDNGML